MVGILTDITKCVGCQKCIKACQNENECPPERPEHKARQGELFNTRWTTIIQKPGQHFVRRLCRHCEEPACVSVCPVAAMTKSPEGPVIYDKSRCMGCRYCMIACPYGIPRYDWDSLAPGVSKCIMCYHRIKKGSEPACTEACPEEATIFGKREELLAEAKRRIKDYPDKYIPTVFGEHEVGGTSVLYISDIPLDFLKFKSDMGKEPPSELSWKALKLTPTIAGGVVFSMAGIRWIIQRRIEIQKNRDKEK